MRGPSKEWKLGPQYVAGLGDNTMSRNGECICGLTIRFYASDKERDTMKPEAERIFGAHVRANHAPISSDVYKASLPVRR